MMKTTKFQYNIFNLAAEGCLCHSVLVLGKEWCLMSTYEEFMVILTIALLIVAILNLKNKK